MGRAQDPNDADLPGLGYKLYWCLAGSVVGSILFLLHRFGLFAALT